MLAIVWHSRTGASEALARAACDGASAIGEVALIRARDATPDILLTADGYLFVGPENLAALSGEMKEMLDRCYYPLLGRIEGRPYAAVIAAGSDGSGAVRQLDRILTGWRLRRVAEPVVVTTFAQEPDSILAPKTLPDPVLHESRRLGEALAEGLRLGVF